MAPARKRRRRITPKTAREWGSVAPQWIGILGLLGQLALWGVTVIASGTGVVEPAMLTAFGGLIIVGQGAEAVVRLQGPPPDPDSRQDAKGRSR